jgi:hypothetical protein
MMEEERPKIYLTDPEMTEREELLQQMYEDNKYLRRKCLGGRVGKSEKEKTKQNWFRVWLACLNAISSLSKEKDLDQMRKDLDILLAENEKRRR